MEYNELKRKKGNFGISKGFAMEKRESVPPALSIFFV